MAPADTDKDLLNNAAQAAPGGSETNSALEPESVDVRTVQPTQERVIPAGRVLMVSLDDNGEEIPGSEFTISEKGYKKHYSDETKFRLKKKAI